MHRQLRILRTAWLMAASGSVFMSAAWASKELARKHNCLACHALDKEVVGPAYQDVAKRYKGRKDAEATVATNIRKVVGDNYLGGSTTTILAGFAPAPGRSGKRGLS